MASGKWVVEAAEAFEIWIIRHRPGPDKKGDMARWLEDCENGPPPGDDVDDRGNISVSGPHDTTIRFRRFDFAESDPPGYMLVLSIRTRRSC